MGIAARLCPFTPVYVQRFLISGLNLGIDARFSRFTPSCVHRFLISSLDLGIAARFSRFTPSFVHWFLISSLDLGIDAASRRCKEEWPACSGRSGDDIRVRFYYSLRERGEADLSWQSNTFKIITSDLSWLTPIDSKIHKSIQYSQNVTNGAWRLENRSGIIILLRFIT